MSPCSGSWRRGQLCRWGLDEDETLAEIVRRDAILRGLSLALPDLRMMLYWRTGDMLEVNPAKDWWHARCGYDWIDPVFYTDPSSSDEADEYDDLVHLTETDGLEAACHAPRLARLAAQPCLRRKIGFVLSLAVRTAAAYRLHLRAGVAHCLPELSRLAAVRH